MFYLEIGSARIPKPAHIFTSDDLKVAYRLKMFDIQGIPPSLTEYSLHAKRPLWLIDNQTAQQGHSADEN